MLKNFSRFEDLESKFLNNFLRLSKDKILNLRYFPLIYSSLMAFYFRTPVLRFDVSLSLSHTHTHTHTHIFPAVFSSFLSPKGKVFEKERKGWGKKIGMGKRERKKERKKERK